MESWDSLLTRLEENLVGLERLEEPLRDHIFELLDGIDTIHRTALGRLGEALGEDALRRLREDPAIAWLLDAYAVGVDERAAADAALEAIRPYIHSHGGKIDVLDAKGGVVYVRLSGACAGCTASAITLQEGIEQALRERFAGFVALDADQDHAEPHPPPGPTLHQIKSFRLD